MPPIILRPEPLSDDAFAPFGQVIQSQGRDPIWINHDETAKYADLAAIDTTLESGRTAVHLYHSRGVSLPFEVRALECHPLGSQAFFPLHERPFPIVVAPAAEQLDPQSIRLFVTNGRQGINLDRGTWHHYQITVGQPGDYLVIDREGPGDTCVANYVEQKLAVGCVITRLAGDFKPASPP